MILGVVTPSMCRNSSENEEYAEPMQSVDSWRRCDTLFLQAKNGNGEQRAQGDTGIVGANEMKWGGGKTIGTNKETMKENILVVWMLLHICYSPLEENNGCGEAFIQ